jgi:hypothetical protein
MNESLKRISDWAKSHPALAIGILVALVLVGYLVYKNSPAGGGLSAGGAESDSSGLTMGGGGNTSIPEETTLPVFTPAVIPTEVFNTTPTYEYAMTPLAFSESYPSFNPAAYTTGPSIDKTGMTGMPNVQTGESIVQTGESIKSPKVVTSADLGALKAQLQKQVYLSGLSTSVKTSAVKGTVETSTKTPLTPTLRPPVIPTVKPPVIPTVKPPSGPATKILKAV